MAASTWYLAHFPLDAREMVVAPPCGQHFMRLYEMLKSRRDIIVLSSPSTCTAIGSMNFKIAGVHCCVHIIADGRSAIRNYLIVLLFLQHISRSCTHIVRTATTEDEKTQKTQLGTLNTLFSEFASSIDERMSSCASWVVHAPTTLAGVVVIGRKAAVTFRVGAKTDLFWFTQCAEGYGNVDVPDCSPESFGGNSAPVPCVNLILLSPPPWCYPASIILASAGTNVSKTDVNIKSHPADQIPALGLQPEHTVVVIRAVYDFHAPNTDWTPRPERKRQKLEWKTALA